MRIDAGAIAVLVLAIVGAIIELRYQNSRRARIRRIEKRIQEQAEQQEPTDA